MKRVVPFLVLVVVTTTARADMLEARIVSVVSSSNLSGPPTWPISYQSVDDYSALQDGQLSTGIEVEGGDNVYNVNGVCDSGGALRVLFETAAEAEELHLDIWLRSFAAPDFWPGPYTGMTLYDATDYHALHSVWLMNGGDDATLHFTGKFDPRGNSFKNEPSVTIDDIRLPGNRFLVTLWGPYMASVHDEGPQGLIVYEIHARYVAVPEPSSVIFGMIALAMVGCLRRRATRLL